MGLDAEFKVYAKKDSEDGVSVAYFRNYHELNDFVIHQTGASTGEAQVNSVIDEEDVAALKAEVEPIAKRLMLLPGNTLDYYDETGYPEALSAELFSTGSFDPCSNGTGRKLMRLYVAIITLECVMEYNDSKVKIMYHSGW